MIGLREDKDPENCFHIKHSKFTRLDFLSEFAHAPFHTCLSFQ